MTNQSTLLEKALRLNDYLGEQVLLGVGNNTIHVYSSKKFNKDVPELWETINVIHHKNAWPKPTKL
jgi:hypothetical protein